MALLGSAVTSAGLLAAIPIYTDAVLQRLLVKELEARQRERGRHPGRTSAMINLFRAASAEERGERFRELDAAIGGAIRSLGLPVLAHTTQLTLSYLRQDNGRDGARLFLSVEALDGLLDEVELVHGRVFGARDDGVLEAIISEYVLRDRPVLLGDELQVSSIAPGGPAFTVRIVGVYRPAADSRLFWPYGLRQYDDSLLVDSGEFRRRFLDGPVSHVAQIRWHYALDYHALRVAALGEVLQRHHEFLRMAEPARVQVQFPLREVIDTYLVRAEQLRLTLTLLLVPVALLLSFFTYLVARLLVESERDAIATLRSRGAGAEQVVGVYLGQAAVLGVVGLAAGPPVGLFISAVIGAADGFLVFVDRTSLPVALSLRAWLFAAAGAALFVLTTVAAAVAARGSIVERKAAQARRESRAPFWHRFYLDGALLAVAAYGYLRFTGGGEGMSPAGTEESPPLDPLLFGVSVAFILGCGLALLRLLPPAVRALAAVGGSRWPAPLYAALIQVGRAPANGQLVALFLLLAVALGIFNSQAARTINASLVDRVAYRVGADIVVEPHFPSAAPATAAPIDAPVSAAVSGVAAGALREPPYHAFGRLEGVERATRVFRRARATVRLPDGATTHAQVLGVVAPEFAQVAYFPPGLLPRHHYRYAQALASSPLALLAGSALRDRHGVRLGDRIEVRWSGQPALAGFVVGFVDYWPTFNPRGEERWLTGIPDRRGPTNLVVANLAYLHAKLALEPYEVWLDTRDGASSAAVYAAMRDEGLVVERLYDTAQVLLGARNDAMVQSTNGALTLGFAIAMLTSVAGFIVFWVMALRTRTLQFGVLRAMGLRPGQVTWMLITELLVLAAGAALIGFAAGRLAADLFIPLVQVAEGAAQVPPFRVTALRTDFLRVYAVVAASLLVQSVVFQLYVARVSVHQALKLGEE